MQDHPTATCPRCHGLNLTLVSSTTYPDEPQRKTLYVYKCVCGMAFTSNDKPPVSALGKVPGN